MGDGASDDGNPGDGIEPGGDVDEQHVRRVRALHELARHQRGKLSLAAAVRASGPPPPRSAYLHGRALTRYSGRCAVLAAALMGTVIAVSIGTLLIVRTLTGHSATAPFTVILPSANNIYCPTAIAWSPDSTRVAVLGYTAACAPQAQTHAGTNSGIVNIYDVRNGHLLMTFQPESIILNGHGVSLPTTTPTPQQGPFGAFLRYNGVFWSPDGQQLALPFYVQTGFYQQFPPYLPYENLGNPPAPAPTLAGVLLTNVTKNSQRVLSAHYADSGARLEWDLSNSTLLSSTVTLQAALGYQWGANGALLPQTPLNTAQPPSVSSPLPVGNPMGASSFSLWQSGVAAPALYALKSNAGANAPTQVTFVPNAYLWYSNFGAWSPDGRYLLTSGYVGARVVVPGLLSPSAAALAAAHLAATPVVSARDAALSGVYSKISSTVATSLPPGAFPVPQIVAWRPDGRVAAALPSVEGLVRQADGSTGTPPLTLLDSATGKTLTVLHPQSNLPTPTGLNSLTGQNIWLQWSPDGQRLLLLDNSLSTLTIWNPAALPNV